MRLREGMERVAMDRGEDGAVWAGMGGGGSVQGWYGLGRNGRGCIGAGLVRAALEGAGLWCGSASALPTMVILRAWELAHLAE